MIRSIGTDRALSIQRPEEPRWRIMTPDIARRRNPAEETGGGAADAPTELSVVIPIYNGSRTIGRLVDRIHTAFAGVRFEIVLVNDGSADGSEEVGRELIAAYPSTVTFVQLARNYGEHQAVLAGLRHAEGQYVAVLDDDGQNPPEEVVRMLAHARSHGLDVVYGRYLHRKHSWPRRLGSWFNGKVANRVLGKPPEIYLSSFKVMSRFVVAELCKYSGTFPYLDGMIFRITDRIGQIDVAHCERQAGKSGYTVSKLVGLWLNMFLGFSVLPLRLALFAGMASAGLSAILIAAIVADKLWINPELTAGIPSVLAGIVFFGGIQLVVLGTLGEYVGRVFLQHSGSPQFIVRYRRRRSPGPADIRQLTGGGDGSADPCVEQPMNRSKAEAL